jgi:3-oxoacyl-[acyl-carrier protein] reductase
MPTLADTNAVVTGASRGLGRAIARELARAGAAVVVNYRSDRQAAEEVVAGIVADGGRAHAFRADVSQEAEVARLAAFALETLGRVDVLVCNAGVTRDGLCAAMSLSEWNDVIDTNLRGPFLCIRAFLRDMIRRKAGSIVALSSVAAERGGRGHANYAASKGGLTAMVRSLAVELAPKRIRVNAVAPGVITTDMTRLIREMGADEILSAIPMARYGEPEEVARAVRFLASDEASYITGEVLHVTGGLGV